jgi:uncharacterized protein (TIRG00374 family)
LSLKLRLVLFLFGLSLAGVVIHQVGLQALLAHLATAGWLLVPVVGVWAIVYFANATGWRTLLSVEKSRPSIWRTWFITVTSFALNYVTPAAGLGGEAYRAAAVAQWLGGKRAVGSVVQYRLLFSLAHMLFVLTALVPAVWLLPHSPASYAMFGVTLVMGGVVSWFLIRRHQEGILEAGLDLLLAVPGIRRLARPMEKKRESLRELDRQITTMYHEHPGAFWRALLIEYIARFLNVAEICIIFWGLGLGPRPVTAFVATALSTTFANLFFFLPFELGAREGGLFLVFKLLGLAPEHGVFAAVVIRLRELAWTLLGLGFLWVSGGKIEAVPGPATGVGGERN